MADSLNQHKINLLFVMMGGGATKESPNMDITLPNTVLLHYMANQPINMFS